MRRCCHRTGILLTCSPYKKESFKNLTREESKWIKSEGEQSTSSKKTKQQKTKHQHPKIKAIERCIKDHHRFKQTYTEEEGGKKVQKVKQKLFQKDALGKKVWSLKGLIFVLLITECFVNTSDSTSDSY